MSTTPTPADIAKFQAVFGRFIPANAMIVSTGGADGSSISDSVALSNVCGQLIAPTSGNITVVMVGGQAVQFYALAGVVYNLMFTQIKATGTAVNNIACFY